VVGAPILLPGETQYGLFLVYPTIQQQEIVDVVQSAIILFAIVLSIGIVSIVGFLTKRITDPVREAADTAQRIASGLIDQRLTVKGKDEIARWAESFNSMTDSLEQQITKLKSLSMVQQRFVSDVSHELRTPVTTVRMAADLLHEQRSTFPPEVARAAELLQSELDRFEVMLSDLLEISRIDAGAAPLNIARCRIHELILETLDSVRPLAVQFNVDLVFKEPSSELTLDCDKRRIQRALRNLIVNAISHSQSPSIEIEAHLSELTVTISVTDFGVGINPDQLKHVFERFWRADPARSRDKGGSGLGLSIAMQDVEQHQGKLLAESGPEIKGTIFKIQLPVKQPGISHEM
jgi:two-component system sensor histidine kinase MtrB